MVGNVFSFYYSTYLAVNIYFYIFITLQHKSKHKRYNRQLSNEVKSTGLRKRKIHCDGWRQMHGRNFNF